MVDPSHPAAAVESVVVSHCGGAAAAASAAVAQVAVAAEAAAVVESVAVFGHAAIVTSGHWSSDTGKMNPQVLILVCRTYGTYGFDDILRL